MRSTPIQLFSPLLDFGCNGRHSSECLIYCSAEGWKCLHYEVLREHRLEAYLSLFTRETALKAALDWYGANVSGGGPSIPFGMCMVPTLYIWGDEDPYLFADPAYLTQDHVSEPYQFLVLDGIGHWVPEDAVDDISQAIINHVTTFLD